jgi:hypothetical protein
MTWKSLFDDPPPSGCKFIALYNDGSGSGLFFRHDDGFIDEDGDDRIELSEGYGLWTELPLGFKFWCEGRSEEPMELLSPQDRETP